MRKRLTQKSRDTLKSIPIFQHVAFEFDDGWFELIYDLGQKLTDFSINNKLPLPQPKQIKEKFGTLRFYCIIPEDKDDQIRNWIRAAETKSETTCETCGEIGKLMVSDGLWYTACDKHIKENSLTPQEFNKIQEERATARRKCDICGTRGSVGYWTGEIMTNRCPEHKEDFITDKQYFEQREKEFKQAKESNESNESK